jgi:hypothetical protein
MVSIDFPENNDKIDKKVKLYEILEVIINKSRKDFFYILY